MAAISAIKQKMRRAAAERGDAFVNGQGRRNADEAQELLGRLPPREFRELDIELGVLQLG